MLLWEHYTQPRERVDGRLRRVEQNTHSQFISPRLACACARHRTSMVRVNGQPKMSCICIIVKKAHTSSFTLAKVLLINLVTSNLID